MIGGEIAEEQADGDHVLQGVVAVGGWWSGPVLSMMGIADLAGDDDLVDVVEAVSTCGMH